MDLQLHNQKARKNNFSDTQVQKIITLVSKNIHIINGLKRRNTGDKEVDVQFIPKHTIREVWRRIMVEVNATDPFSTPRTADEIRKKWNDMRYAVHKYNNKKKNGPGGGAPVMKPFFYEAVMDVISGPNVSQSGDSDPPEPKVEEIDDQAFEIIEPETPDTTEDTVASFSTEEVKEGLDLESWGFDTSNIQVLPKDPKDWTFTKHKRSKEIDEEPWGEFLRSKIRLNKVRERVLLLQEVKLKKEIEKLDKELRSSSRNESG